jgi:hypothetical protein
MASSRSQYSRASGVVTRVEAPGQGHNSICSWFAVLVARNLFGEGAPASFDINSQTLTQWIDEAKTRTKQERDATMNIPEINEQLGLYLFRDAGDAGTPVIEKDITYVALENEYRKDMALMSVEYDLTRQLKKPGLYIMMCNGRTLCIYHQDKGPYIVLNSHSSPSMLNSRVDKAYAQTYVCRDDALDDVLRHVDYRVDGNIHEGGQVEVIWVHREETPTVTLSNLANRGGGAPRSSPWIEHVKAYAKRHKLTYKDALSSASPSYKSRKKAKKV